MDSLASSLVLVILLLDITTPYRSSLDGVLTGRKARGSAFRHQHAKFSSTSSENPSSTSRTTSESGEKIKLVKPPSVEEPLSLASRSLFSYLQPLIWKYYWTPIEVKDIPELREDDRTSVVVGGWREFRERERRGLKHPEGAKLPEGKGSLSWKLLVYFKGYFALQGVSLDLRSVPCEEEDRRVASRLTPRLASFVFAALVGRLRLRLLPRSSHSQAHSRVHRLSEALDLGP